MPRRPAPEGASDQMSAPADLRPGAIGRPYPGRAERVVFCEAATPLTHTRFTGSTGGTSYGIAGAMASGVAAARAVLRADASPRR